jgi:hypothetical protein
MLRLGLAGRLVLLCGVMALPCAQAAAATAAMMTIGEPNQGKGKGSKQNKNAAPSTEIELLSVTRSGTDAAATGAGAGKRGSPAANTLIVTKFYEANSAQLEQAAATNEVLHQVTIEFETAVDRNLGASNGKVKGNANKTSASGGAAASRPNAAQVLVLKNVQVDEVEQTKNIQKITLEYSPSR